MRTTLFTRPARLVLVGALALGAAGALGACGDLDTPAPGGTIGQADDGAKTEDTKADDKADKPALTMQEQQAQRSAQNYLDIMGMSRSGLIKQLEFDGFTRDEAKAAVKSLDPKPDWNDEAAQAAQNYLDTMGMSRSGLIEQLRFDGFTKAQAEHGADEVGL